jgi:hypothetical protein
MEFFPGTNPIPALYCYDGRAMYMGCCNGLGYAGGRWLQMSQEDIQPGDRGRAKVVFSAPANWQHVGLLAVKREGGAGWHWPVSGDWETWADCAEIRLARQQGWSVHVMDKLVWPEADPLGLWATRLSRLYLADGSAGQGLVGRCARAICLHTIGWFHNLGYTDQRSIVSPDDPRVTIDNVEWDTDEGYQIKERVLTGKKPEHCHPEWSAAIWARARLRVTKALLETPRDDLVAVRGDAIYRTSLAKADPGRLMDPWKDGGDVGRLRLKWDQHVRRLRPTSWSAIDGMEMIRAA